MIVGQQGDLLTYGSKHGRYPPARTTISLNFDWTCRGSRVLFQWATWLRWTDCFTSDLRRADEQLEVPDIDIFAAFSTDRAFWGILFLDRKPGSGSRDKHSWMCLSLDSSIAVIIDILACSPSWGRNRRFRTSGWNIVAKVQHLGRFLDILCNLLDFN